VGKLSIYGLIILLTLTLFCGVVEKLANKNPIINSVTANPAQIGIQDTTTLMVEAEDPDGDLMSFRWSSNAGAFLSTSGETVQWVAPNSANRYRIEVTVTDEKGGKATGEVWVNVRGDESPIVTIVHPIEGQVIPGIGTVVIEANVDFDWPIERVDFFLNRDSLLFSDYVSPYKFTEWNVAGMAGEVAISARAYEKAKLDNFGEDSVHVIIAGVVPVPK